MVVATVIALVGTEDLHWELCRLEAHYTMAGPEYKSLGDRVYGLPGFGAWRTCAAI